MLTLRRSQQPCQQRAHTRSTLYHLVRVNFIFIFFSIKRINWKYKNLVQCTWTYIRISLLLLEVINPQMFPENGTSEFFLIRWTINQQAGKCLLHQCLPMPASACQNLYIVRWTRIYIRLLLLFKNSPSPSFSTFEGFLFIDKLYSSSRARELPVVLQLCTLYHLVRVNFIFIFFSIKRINWKYKNLVQCT